MKKKLFVFTLVLALLLTACGGSSNYQKTEAAMDYAVEAPMAAAPMEMDEAGSGALNSAASSGSTALPQGRKWVITVHMSAETDDLDAMTAALDDKITSLNGYVEDQNVYNGSNRSSRRYRYADLTIRIPAQDVDKFTQEVAGIANVVSKETNREDITLSYVATESRLTALQTEEARLLELLAKAETMADLLEIEARLTDVRYELENHGSRLRLYDNQVDYATIYLHIEEVQEYTPVEEPTLWERIRDGFRGSIKGLVESLQDLLVFLITASPFLVVYGGIFLILFWLTQGLRKGLKLKKLKFGKKKKNEELK